MQTNNYLRRALVAVQPVDHLQPRKMSWRIKLENFPSDTDSFI